MFSNLDKKYVSKLTKIKTPIVSKAVASSIVLAIASTIQLASKTKSLSNLPVQHMRPTSPVNGKVVFENENGVFEVVLNGFYPFRTLAGYLGEKVYSGKTSDNKLRNRFFSAYMAGGAGLPVQYESMYYLAFTILSTLSGFPPTSGKDNLQSSFNGLSALAGIEKAGIEINAVIVGNDGTKNIITHKGHSTIVGTLDFYASLARDKMSGTDNQDDKAIDFDYSDLEVEL